MPGAWAAGRDLVKGDHPQDRDWGAEDSAGRQYDDHEAWDTDRNRYHKTARILHPGHAGRTRGKLQALEVKGNQDPGEGREDNAESNADGV